MTGRASWTYAMGLVVVAILLVRSLFAVPYLPTNDGPEHVFASHVENHYGDPGTPYADYLIPAPEYASRGFTLVYTPLEDWLGWRLALSTTLAITVLLYALGFVACAHALPRPRWPLAFLGFPLALTWELYMGFFAFALGSAVGLFVLALALRWRTPNGTQRFVLGFLLLAQAVCHVFTAVLTGLVVAALFTMRALRGDRARETIRVALMALPAASILALAVLSGSSQVKVPFQDRTIILPIAITLLHLPRTILPGPWWRALAATGLIVVALGAGAIRTTKGRTDTTDRVLLGCGAAFLLASISFPIVIPGWQFFSQRFVPLGAALCVLGLPVETLGSPRRVLGVALSLFAFSAASLLASAPFHRRLAASIDDAILGLSAPVARRGLWLPITLAPQGGLPMDALSSEVPALMPLRHMPMLYAVAEGGFTPYSMSASAANHPFVLRTDAKPLPPVPIPEKYVPLIESDSFDEDPAFRHGVVNELATYGMFYEGILVTGAQTADLELLRARGFASDWDHGSVFVGHWVPCRLDIELPSDAERPRIDVGVGTQVILRDETAPISSRADGARHEVLPRSPCGAVWVRPHWDTGADGSTSRRFCENSSPNGEIATTVTWAFGTVRCSVPKEGRRP